MPHPVGTKLPSFLLSVGFFLLFALSLRLLFPFYLALVTVSGIAAIASRLQRHSRLSERALRLVLLAVSAILLLSLAAIVARGIVKESEGFFASLFETVKMALTSLYRFAKRLKEAWHIGDFLSDERLTALAGTLFERLTAALSTKLATAAAAFVKALPQAVLATVLYLFSLFYIAADYEKIHAVIRKLIPQSLKAPLSRLKHSTLSLLCHTLKAYGVLFLITFFILSLAFFLMKIDYPLWWALLAAGLDALPAIGIGMILIPWGCGLLVSGHTATGVAMLALYAVMTVLRQALEPRILGRELGVPPLLSLLSLYLGFRLFGGWGLLLSPLLSVLFTRLFHYITAERQTKGASL